MKKRTRQQSASTPRAMDATSCAPALGLAPFGPDVLADKLRAMVGGLIQELVATELTEALQARRYQRSCDVEGRRGYRHTKRERELTTSLGPTTIQLQRARLFDEAGQPTQEWQSTLLPRYARRAPAIDNAILGSYLAGTNTRRIRGALRPLLQGGPVSKSAVSRIIQTLKRSFEAWRTTPLTDKRIVFVFLDAIAVKVRSDRRVQTLPVLVAYGVHTNGDKELLALRLMGSESTAAWQAMVDDLVARGLEPPVLCIIDGNAGLRRAVVTAWPQTLVQRCVVHKLRNLEAHAPKRALDEVRADFQSITTAENEKAARAAYTRFIRSWQRRCEPVVTSLKEAGEELLTFYRFPSSQWKCLRTTNMIERLHLEFRRRIKTQASLPNEGTVLRLFFALYQSGQIHTRRVDGWQQIPVVLELHAADHLKSVA
jgi:putative transposase